MKKPYDPNISYPSWCIAQKNIYHPIRTAQILFRIWCKYFFKIQKYTDSYYKNDNDDNFKYLVYYFYWPHDNTFDFFKWPTFLEWVFFDYTDFDNCFIIYDPLFHDTRFILDLQKKGRQNRQAYSKYFLEKRIYEIDKLQNLEKLATDKKEKEYNYNNWYLDGYNTIDDSKL